MNIYIYICLYVIGVRSPGTLMYEDQDYDKGNERCGRIKFK